MGDGQWSSAAVLEFQIVNALCFRVVCSLFCGREAPEYGIRQGLDLLVPEPVQFGNSGFIFHDDLGRAEGKLGTHQLYTF